MSDSIYKMMGDGLVKDGDLAATVFTLLYGLPK